MKDLIMSTKNIDELVDSIATTVIDRMSKLKPEKPQAQDELLTREETCDLLKINSSTLWHWTNKGKVKAYGIGNRRYYKRNEILENLTPLK